MTRIAILAVVTVAATIPPAAAQTAAPPAQAWWGHVEALAHDSMRGRAAGSPEHRKAAEYVAAQFERVGLRPAGVDGWFQPVRFDVRRLDERRSSAALVHKGKVEPLVLGRDATIGVRSSREGSVDAPLVFAGYGVRAPEHGHDDFAGLDLRGKVVVLLSGTAPAGIPGPALAAGRAAGGAAIQSGGAVGVVSVYAPHGDLPWSRYVLSRLQPEMRLAGDSAASHGSNLVVVVVGPDKAHRLFAGARHGYASLRALADSGAPLPSFQLPARLRATAAMQQDTAVSDNVVGLLPGADSAVADEFVALTAHLDHLGVAAGERDSIYNGAMDNASGIAALIETAGALARRTPRLRRPVLFVAVTAEEKGLLGSDYFAGHPTMADDGALVANVNTDMFLPINPLRRLLVNGLEESDLADDVRRAAGRVGVEVITDPEPERNAFVRSDQFSFIRRGIPAVSLKVGFTLDSPEHVRVLQWRKERYHGVDDEIDQPVDRQAAADFTRLYAEIVTEIANRPTRPAWYPTSAFRPEGQGTE